jgi:hypothetical protein
VSSISFRNCRQSWQRCVAHLHNDGERPDCQRVRHIRNRTYTQQAIAQHIPTRAIATVACGQLRIGSVTYLPDLGNEKGGTHDEAEENQPGRPDVAQHKGHCRESSPKVEPTSWQPQRATMSRSLCLPFSYHLPDLVHFCVLFFVGIVFINLRGSLFSCRLE